MTRSEKRDNQRPCGQPCTQWVVLCSSCGSQGTRPQASQHSHACWQRCPRCCTTVHQSLTDSNTCNSLHRRVHRQAAKLHCSCLEDPRPPQLLEMLHTGSHGTPHGKVTTYPCAGSRTARTYVAAPSLPQLSHLTTHTRQPVRLQDCTYGSRSVNRRSRSKGSYACRLRRTACLQPPPAPRTFGKTKAASVCRRSMAVWRRRAANDDTSTPACVVPCSCS